jgi:hypothetical protein
MNTSFLKFCLRAFFLSSPKTPLACLLGISSDSRLYDCETLVRLGLPFVSFTSLLESRSLGRALRMHDLHTLFPCHRFRYATMGALITTGN